MSQIYPNDADGDALRQLAAHGNDMARPMEIDYFVAVTDEASGKKIAAVASRLGYKVSVEEDEKEDDEEEDDDGQAHWTCYCTKTMLATYDGVVAAQRELGTVSEPLGGLVDGWGTMGNV